MTATQTQSNPAQSPDAQPVTAVDPNTARLLAERDGYRQALETEKVLRASDVRELRAALETILEGAAPQGRETWTLADVIQEHYRIARTALARGTK